MAGDFRLNSSFTILPEYLLPAARNDKKLGLAVGVSKGKMASTDTFSVHGAGVHERSWVFTPVHAHQIVKVEC